MLLVDTSVWVDHLRRGDERLAATLKEGGVLTHQAVIEELACGNLRDRRTILQLIQALPSAPGISHIEFLAFVESQGLAGLGLGAADVHLLASARLSRCPLWTRDRVLRREAARLGVLAAEA